MTHHYSCRHCCVVALTHLNCQPLLEDIKRISKKGLQGSRKDVQEQMEFCSAHHQKVQIFNLVKLNNDRKGLDSRPCFSKSRK